MKTMENVTVYRYDCTLRDTDVHDKFPSGNNKVCPYPHSDTLCNLLSGHFYGWSDDKTQTQFVKEGMRESTVCSGGKTWTSFTWWLSKKNEHYVRFFLRNLKQILKTKDFLCF